MKRRHDIYYDLNIWYIDYEEKEESRIAYKWYLFNHFPVAPLILEGPESLQVKEAETITITYKINQGDPQATATWYKVEETLKTNDKYTIEITSETVSLTINKTKVEDSATYTLKLENLAGSVNYSTTLTVARKFVFYMINE